MQWITGSLCKEASRSNMFVFPVTIIVSLLLKCLKKSESGEAGCDARWGWSLSLTKKLDFIFIYSCWRWEKLGLFWVLSYSPGKTSMSQMWPWSSSIPDIWPRGRVYQTELALRVEAKRGLTKAADVPHAHQPSQTSTSQIQHLQKLAIKAAGGAINTADNNKETSLITRQTKQQVDFLQS